jgi:hypothetical protein
LADIEIEATLSISPHNLSQVLIEIIAASSQRVGKMITRHLFTDFNCNIAFCQTKILENSGARTMALTGICIDIFMDWAVERPHGLEI